MELRELGKDPPEIVRCAVVFAREGPFVGAWMGLFGGRRKSHQVNSPCLSLVRAKEHASFWSSASIYEERRLSHKRW